MDFQNRPFPISREEWASLNWKDAQGQLGSLIKSAGFMKFEEKSLSKSNRADLMVIRSTKECVYIGIIEVKSYRRITRKIASDAVVQACRYISAIHQSVLNRYNWKDKNKVYFGVAVFTKDYPNILFNPQISQFKEYLPKELIEDKRVVLLSCVPENLLKSLQVRGLASPIQNSLDKYY
jgi:hypothetical protein